MSIRETMTAALTNSIGPSPGLVMIDEQARLSTFKDWPFTTEEGATCTAEKMASAGFFCPNPEKEPDLVRCFVCRKELDGWEPTDDPIKEHVNHSKGCYFLKFRRRKNFLNITMEECLRLQFHIVTNYLNAVEKVTLEFYNEQEKPEYEKVKKALKAKELSRSKLDDSL